MQSQGKLFLLAIMVVLLMVSFAVTTLFFPDILKKNSLSFSSENRDTVSLNGRIVISATVGNEVIPGLHVIDLSSRTIDAFPKNDEQIAYHFNTNGISSAYVGTSLSDLKYALESDGDLTKAFQIHQIKSAYPEDIVVSSNNRLTDNEITDKRFLSLSPDNNNLLFVTRDINPFEEDLEPSSFKDFQINSVNLDSQKTQVYFSGSSPVWIDSDKFAFTDPQGVKIYDVKSKKTETVFNSPLANNAKLDYSNSRNQILLTVPDMRKVFVIDADSSSEKYGSILSELSELAYWAVFSPMDDMVAIQTTLPDATTTPLLKFYSFSQLKFKKLDEIALTGFDNESFFLNQWIK